MIDAVRRLLAAAEEGGLDLPENAAERFELYLDAVISRGERLSLFSRAELLIENVADHHLLDSLRALLFAKPRRGGRLIDFGAGSGVVGVTWKILRPDLSVVFLEAMKRKAFFLDGVIRLLRFHGAEVWEGRAEEVARREGNRFDAVVVRGVAADRKSVRAARHFLKPFGEVLFFKGPATAPEIRRLIQADGELSAVREENVFLGDGKRRIYVLASKVPVAG